jgi:hypothetical protein
MGTIDQAQSTTRATVQSKHRHMNGRHPPRESTLTSVLTVLSILACPSRRNVPPSRLRVHPSNGTGLGITLCPCRADHMRVKAR